MSSIRTLRAPLTFVGLYLLASVVGALTGGNQEFLFYILVMLVLISVLWVVNRRVGLTPGVVWCLATWGALHMAGGLIHVPSGWPTSGGSVLYNLWLIEDWFKYDQLTHAFGFGTATWVCWLGLQAAVERDLRPTFGLLTLCVLAACGLGAINEIVEFLATVLGPTNVGGYVNTALDLVFNLIGAVTAATLIAVSESRRSA